MTKMTDVKWHQIDKPTWFKCMYRLTPTDPEVTTSCVCLHDTRGGDGFTLLLWNPHFKIWTRHEPLSPDFVIEQVDTRGGHHLHGVAL